MEPWEVPGATPEQNQRNYVTWVASGGPMSNTGDFEQQQREAGRHSAEAIIAGAVLGRALASRARTSPLTPLTRVQKTAVNTGAVVGWIFIGLFVLIILGAVFH